MRNRGKLILCCLCHFLVDLACAWLLLSGQDQSGGWAEALILYNFCAFALQMPLGLVADVRPEIPYASLGLTLCAAGGFSGSFWFTVLLLGLGNALFHVGAGKWVMDHQSGCSALGFFVAPGAFGITLGTLLAMRTRAPWGLILILLVGAAAMLFPGKESQTAVLPDQSVKPKAVVWAVLIFFVVVIRSFVGLTWQFAWSAEAGWAMTAAVAAGKAGGGLAADQFGLQRICRVSLLLALACLIFADLPILGLAGVFFFNMTMPLCLRLMQDQLPGHSGFAFGILTFALFLGFLPRIFGISVIARWVTLGFTALSLILLTAVVRKGESC